MTAGSLLPLPSFSIPLHHRGVTLLRVPEVLVQVQRLAGETSTEKKPKPGPSKVGHLLGRAHVGNWSQRSTQGTDICTFPTQEIRCHRELSPGVSAPDQS